MVEGSYRLRDAVKFWVAWGIHLAYLAVKRMIWYRYELSFLFRNIW
jgi:hypothetical protein